MKIESSRSQGDRTSGSKGTVKQKVEALSDTKYPDGCLDFDYLKEDCNEYKSVVIPPLGKDKDTHMEGSNHQRRNILLRKRGKP